MLRHREDAEDATQETFLRVAKNLHRWDNSKRFEPWLLTIAGNRCRTRLARLANKPNSVTLEHCPEDSSHLDTPAALLSEEVKQALETVRPEFRDAFTMFYERELSYAEIADVLGITLSNVGVRINRIKNKLSQQLKNSLYES